MAPFMTIIAVLVLFLLAPVVRADTLLYVERVAVHDANGRQVGSTWPTTWSPVWREVRWMYVEFRVGSTPVTVTLRPDGFKFDALLFPQPGCTGQALVYAFPQPLPVVAQAAPRATVYVQSGGFRERMTRSFLNERARCIDREPLRVNTVPVRSTGVNLADEFVPPFTTRTRAGTAVPIGAP
jgi:hypothetical protein